MQSTRHSLLEALTNIVVGLVINGALNTTLVILLGVRSPLHVAGWVIGISVIFLMSSFLRLFIIRRIFNRWSVDASSGL